MAQIITIGEILAEVMAKEVGQQFDATGTFIGPFPSGAPAIFVDQAAKCGATTMIISAVGDDGFGAINLRRLQASGVDISRVRVLADATTGVAFVTYQQDGSRDFLFHIANAACGRIDEQFVEEADFRDCNYFHVMGSSLYSEGMYRSIARGLEYARRHGSAISFDPNVRKEIQRDETTRRRLVEILALAQVVLAGEHELFYLTGEADETAAVAELLAGSAQIVVIKRGARGATLYTGGRVIHSGVAPVEEVDPTGAGDCFAGTFISCLNHRLPASEAFQLAAIAGARAVTQKGPMEGNTTLQELREVLAATSR
ncbi:MAG: sugar kinase [Chloroflexales bacterium]|nr:sugar kinase [Chloroflexales bacterium]